MSVHLQALMFLQYIGGMGGENIGKEDISLGWVQSVAKVLKIYLQLTLLKSKIHNE